MYHSNATTKNMYQLLYAQLLYACYLVFAICSVASTSIDNPV
jgi:hypothetical protein